MYVMIICTPPTSSNWLNRPKSPRSKRGTVLVYQRQENKWQIVRRGDIPPPPGRKLEKIIITWNQKTNKEALAAPSYLFPHIPRRAKTGHQVVFGPDGFRGQAADTVRTSADVIQVGNRDSRAVAANAARVTGSLGVLESRWRSKV